MKDAEVYKEETDKKTALPSNGWKCCLFQAITERKEALDLLTSNIYLIINLLLVHFAINSQIYNIQFAYKIEDLRKIVMQKYHYKKFYRGR